MRLENDMKLDYKDVLIRPKRSTLHSRREVTLERTYTFRHGRNKLGLVYRSWLPTWMALGHLVSTVHLQNTNCLLVL